MISQAIVTSFKKEVLQGVHNLDSDVFKLALYTSNANLSSATTGYLALGETAGTGYTAGGMTLTNLGVSESGTQAYASWGDVTWPNASFTAAGGLIYNSSKGNKAVAVLNFGGTYTVNTSVPFTVAFPPNNSTTAIIIFN